LSQRTKLYTADLLRALEPETQPVSRADQEFAVILKPAGFVFRARETLDLRKSGPLCQPKLKASCWLPKH
jgi:hypothetical protein